MSQPLAPLVLLVSPDADLVGVLRDALEEVGLATALARGADEVAARHGGARRGARIAARDRAGAGGDGRRPAPAGAAGRAAAAHHRGGAGRPAKPFSVEEFLDAVRGALAPARSP